MTKINWNKRTFTAEYLRSVLEYNPDTGEWIWLKCRGGRKIGSSAGSIFSGRRTIFMKGEYYPTSQLAWLYITGEWPIDTVDHCDRDPSNEKWNNLRLATQSQQNMNRGLSIRNTSGILGVWKSNNKWISDIMVNKERIYLGCFNSKEEAIKIRKEAEQKYFGEFNPNV